MIVAVVWHWWWTAVLIVPVAMIGRRTFRALALLAIRVKDDGRPLSLRDRVLLRFQRQGAHPLFFAWCKTRQDAMFTELPEMLRPVTGVKTILDLGCGFGVAGTFLLELFPEARVYGVDPSPGRVAAASKVFGERGRAFVGAAPDFEQPDFPEKFDAAFFLDVLHFLDDAALEQTLSRIRARLDEGNYLIVRAPMRPIGSGSLIWKLSWIHYTVWKIHIRYRTVERLREQFEQAGFELVDSRISGNNPELRWFVSRAAPLEQKVERLMLEPVPAVRDDGEQHHR